MFLLLLIIRMVTDGFDSRDDESGDGNQDDAMLAWG